MDHYSVTTMITPVIACMMIIIMMMIGADSHYCKGCIIRRIIMVIIRRIIRHINRGIYILHNGC